MQTPEALNLADALPVPEPLGSFLAIVKKVRKWRRQYHWLALKKKSEIWYQLSWELRAGNNGWEKKAWTSMRAEVDRKMRQVEISPESLMNDGVCAHMCEIFVHGNVKIWSRSFTRGERQCLTWWLCQGTPEAIDSVINCHQIKLLKLSDLPPSPCDDSTPDYISTCLGNQPSFLPWTPRFNLDSLNPRGIFFLIMTLPGVGAFNTSPWFSMRGKLLNAAHKAPPRPPSLPPWGPLFFLVCDTPSTYRHSLCSIYSPGSVLLHTLLLGSFITCHFHHFLQQAPLTGDMLCVSLIKIIFLLYSNCLSMPLCIVLHYENINILGMLFTIKWPKPSTWSHGIKSAQYIFSIFIE